MRRKTKLVVGTACALALFVGLSVTTMGFSTEYVEPTQLVEGDEYDDQAVKLEGRAVDVSGDIDGVEFDMVDQNHSVPVIYDGEMPETMSDGRQVVAEGVYDGETLSADDLVVRAHEGEGDGEHPGDVSGDGYDDRQEYDG